MLVTLFPQNDVAQEIDHLYKENLPQKKFYTNIKPSDVIYCTYTIILENGKHVPCFYLVLV